MKHRFLSLALTLAMLASLLVPSFTAGAETFSDVEGHWAESSVERWSGAGVVNGTGAGFNPDANMTRAEFAQILVNLMGYTEKGTVSCAAP